MNDEKPAAGEASRIEARAVPVTAVERDVTEHVVGRARPRATPVDTRSISNAAGATTSAAAAGELSAASSADAFYGPARLHPGWNLAGRMAAIDYLFGAAYLLLTARLLLALVNADTAAGVARAINALAEPLYAPIRSFVRVSATEAGQTLALPILIALIGFMLVHASISGLVRVTRQRLPMV